MKAGIYVVRDAENEPEIASTLSDENGNTYFCLPSSMAVLNSKLCEIIAGPFTPEQIAALPRLVRAARSTQAACTAGAMFAHYCLLGHALAPFEDMPCK